ncbi:MAG: hypothetical protein ACYDAN_03835 [Candidatus Limnocylindrales bacterium]
MPLLRRTLLLVGAIGFAVVYLRKLRPWQLTWGATPDEVSEAWPSDDLVAAPTFAATRAIPVHARPESIWPWIVQVGVGRAGWYSYDLFDNLGRQSSWQILPAFQILEPGDMVPMSPDGSQGIRVLANDGVGHPWRDDLGVAPGAPGRRIDAPAHSRPGPRPLDVARHRVLGVARVRRHADDAPHAAQHPGARRGTGGVGRRRLTSVRRASNHSCRRPAAITSEDRPARREQARRVETPAAYHRLLIGPYPVETIW